jgi:hypothetical protein
VKYDEDWLPFEYNWYGYLSYRSGKLPDGFHGVLVSLGDEAGNLRALARRPQPPGAFLNRGPVSMLIALHDDEVRVNLAGWFVPAELEDFSLDIVDLVGGGAGGVVLSMTATPQPPWPYTYLYIGPDWLS